jgi:hypothetical protein
MKIKTSLLLVLTLLISACSMWNKDQKRNPSSYGHRHIELYNAQEYLYNEEVEDFQNLLEENLVWRTHAISFLKQLQNHTILTSDQLITLHEDGTEKYISFRNRFFKYIERVKWITDRDNKLYIQSSGDTRIKEHFRRRKVHGEWKTFKYKKIYINPNDVEGVRMVKEIKMALAATLTLYDNYTLIISQFQEFDKIRHLLNYDKGDDKYALAKLTKSYNSISNFKRVKKVVDAYKEIVEKDMLKSETKFQYFDYVITHSISYDKLNKEFKKSLWKRKWKYITDFLKDYFKEAKNNTTHVVSKVFGNSIGLIASRKGMLYKMPNEEIKELEKELKPLDVLLEKTPFRLTDKFIPGHWGHVAIWTGTKQELIELELWDHPLIIPHQHAIEHEGRRIIEALRPGVQINTMKHFLNIDDLAVIRPNHLSKAQTQEYLVNAFKQIGKTYDFNFDVETDEKIVCSELAYVTFDDQPWPTENQVGRQTISPDNVAIKARQEGNFHPVMIYHNGKRITQNLRDNFNYLLDKKYELIKF